MQSLKNLSFLLALLASLATAAAAAEDVASMARDCNGCHGADGISTDADMPTIAGVSEFVHFDALLAYAESARPCATSKYRHGDTSRAATSMCQVVEGMSEENMEAIAQYYAAKPFVAAKQDIDAGLAAKGLAIHEAQCDKCHSEGGSVAEDDAGIQAGQQMGYLRQTFAEYASGDRDQPKSMKTRLDALSKEDTEALVHYYGSQQ